MDSGRAAPWVIARNFAVETCCYAPFAIPARGHFYDRIEPQIDWLIFPSSIGIARLLHNDSLMIWDMHWQLFNTSFASCSCSLMWFASMRSGLPNNFIEHNLYSFEKIPLWCLRWRRGSHSKNHWYLPELTNKNGTIFIIFRLSPIVGKRGS